MNRNMMIGLAVLALVVVGGGLFWMNSQNKNTQNTQTPAVNEQATSAPMESEATGSSQTGEVKEFTVTGSNFRFTPTNLTVNQGDTVKINFTSSAGIHDFVLDEFDVRTKQISSGTESVTFVADKTGSFEYYCSVGNHRQMGMKGTLVVQ